MPYIKQCLDSILNQTFQDFKIIIVDDLSTDLSDKFCEMYARKYPTKIVFIRAKRKGHEGGSRNVGIEYPLDSCYTYFVDGDDYLYSNDVLKTVYATAKSLSYDVLLVNMMQTYDCIKFVPVGNFQHDFNWNSSAICMSRWNSASGKFVKTQCIVPFLEDCDHGADAYQWTCLLDKSPSICQTNVLAYIYRRNAASLTLNPNSNYVSDTEKFYSKLNELLPKLSNKHVINSVKYRIELYRKGAITK